MVVFARRIPRENARGLAFVARRLANGILCIVVVQKPVGNPMTTQSWRAVRQSDLHFAKYHPRLNTATQCTP